MVELTLNGSPAAWWIPRSNVGKLVTEALTQLLEIGPVDSDPGRLHPGEHRHQGSLDLGVQVELSPLFQLGTQLARQPGGDHRPPTGVIDVGPFREVEHPLGTAPAVGLIGGPQLEPEVSQRQLAQVVRPCCRLHHVGGEGGVEQGAVDRQPLLDEMAEEVLGVVRHPLPRGVTDRLEQWAGRCHRHVSGGAVFGHGQPGQLVAFPYRYQHQRARFGQSGDLAGVGDPGYVHFESLRPRRLVRPEGVQLIEDAVELEALEQVLGDTAVPWRPHQLGGGDAQVEIVDQTHQPLVEEDLVAMLLQVGFEPWAVIVEVLVDALEVAVLGDQP